MIGHHYIVTGGTSGLGLEIVKQLLKKGAYVTVIARNKTKFNNIQFGPYQSKVSMIHCDLQDREAIANVASNINTPINGLIYSSGLGYFKSVAHHTAEEMIETYDVNLISFNLLYNILRPYFSNKATIVGISSQAAFVTQANAAHYGASKAALNAILNALRIEESQFHFMAVNPGPIKTPFHEKADPSLKYAQTYDSIMIDPQQLAKDIIEGIIKRKKEINQPKWMYHLLKIYQLAPRTLEQWLTPLFKNKI
ncbi:SDR family NAD(P)-dependent oxidoreductase [Staphylococcus pragensis]|uniref:SDR family NAD(P)-dependent oxidoreductase n=1 Tax=Staphylococcus pragensis TaxID=1611836 RepID=A0A4Z1BF40_9STAP|nr:SDR family NAD(P)-dependent oxidoreductase [Staphylococcus pragensis]RTX87530.1 SDR family NAD(P)-dependent oxidoreductase [Staphylococcus carnosus]TGN28828.1 SDR family NAD(P)-dependent oxidoreductase [Staphylococcus pragensis]GGG84759.1 oxidoreductase [Staphylococcus pragensis]